MSGIETNRDLYLAITGFIARHQRCTRSLEEYLLALWDAGRGYSALPRLTVDEFFELLSVAFTKPFPPFDDAWRNRDEEVEDTPSGFAGWEACVLDQIVDLREMAEEGLLNDRFRYFGIDSPNGGRWYNFDPCTFLECGTEGFFGGWESGDKNGRMMVPGPVAVRGDDGKIESRDPADVATPRYSITQINWDDFHTFLRLAQMYE